MKQFLLLLFLLTLNNCVDQLSNDIPFTLYNQTDKTVKVLGYDRQISFPKGKADPIVINPNSEFTVIKMSGLNTNVSNAFYSIIGVDSVNVIFDDKKIKTYDGGSLEDAPCTICFGNKDYEHHITEQDYLEASPLVFKDGFLGSRWRCTAGAGLQEGLIYNEFRFISATQVEGWALFEGETQAEHFFTANYQINGEEISITDEGESFMARLNEDYTGLITNIDEVGECVFFRQ